MSRPQSDQSTGGNEDEYDPREKKYQKLYQKIVRQKSPGDRTPRMCFLDDPRLKSEELNSQYRDGYTRGAVDREYQK